MTWETILILCALAVVAALAFVALFKSGKREAAIDLWFDKLIADPGTPISIRALALKARDLHLTSLAQAGKAQMNAIETMGKEQADRLEAKIDQLLGK